MNQTVFVDEAHGNHIVALTEQSFGDVVATRGILVVGMSDLLAIQIGDVLVEERTKQQTGRLAGMSLIYLNMLTEPDGADDGATGCGRHSPLGIPLADALPLAVIVIG